MKVTTIADPVNAVVDPVTRSADQAIRSTQHAATAALDSIAESAQTLRRETAPLLDRAADRASTLAHRGIDAVKDATHQVRAQAQSTSDRTVDYIRAEPVKAVLIAAAAGAALTGAVVLLSRSRDRR